MGRTASILVHRAWLGTQRRAARAFDTALAAPRTTQAALLRNALERNRQSAFGSLHGFSRIRSIEDFRAAVPIRTYQDFLPWIERAMRGERNVLTNAAVIMFECTSGSAGAAKFIPYTSSLLRQFQRALAPWMCDLYGADPRLSHGPAYWSITPVSRARSHTEGGTPIGLKFDSDYLGPIAAWFANRLLAVPREIAESGTIDSAVYLTLRFLLQSRSLTLLSVWNPSFLIVLCRAIEMRGDQLVRDLRSGEVSGCGRLPERIADRLRRRARPDSRQAAILNSMLRRGALQPLALWPQLRAISCWTSVEAVGVVSEVRELFPGVRLQPKGLLATEGVTSIPLERFAGAVPALTSHFLEFLSIDDGRAHLVDELERSRQYVPVLTTGGGLWRYRTGDRVRVTDVVGGIPVLEFAGRDDGVCDLRGEKLHPVFVSGVLDAMRRRGSLRPTFAMLTPAEDRNGYVLFTDSPIADRELLDSLLRANPQYAYCRDLGQLRAPEVFHIAGDAHAQYLRHCERTNRRAGAVKLLPLDRASGWSEAFARLTESTR